VYFLFSDHNGLGPYSIEHTPTKQAKRPTRLLVCDFGTFRWSFAWFCETKHQIDSIFVLHEIDDILRWMCFFTLPLGHFFHLSILIGLGLYSNVHTPSKQAKRPKRLLVCNFGTFWWSFAWFCEIRQQKDSIFVLHRHHFTLNLLFYIAIGAYFSFFDPNGPRVIDHSTFTIKTVKTPDKITRIRILDVLLVICMILWN
jgi:hypothetical protein